MNVSKLFPCSLRFQLHNKARGDGMRLLWHALGIAASVNGGLSLLLFIFQPSHGSWMLGNFLDKQMNAAALARC